MSIQPTPVYKFTAIHIKIPIKNRKIHLKIHVESQETQNSQHNSEKEQKNWRTHTFLFQKLLLQSYCN